MATDAEGRFEIVAVPPGAHRVEAGAAGFRTEVIDDLTFEVGRTLVRDFRLAVGDQRETVVGQRGSARCIDRATSHRRPRRHRRRPCRRFRSTAATSSISGCSCPGRWRRRRPGSRPRRFAAVGALAFNTAGNREEAVGFLVNGVTTNNLTFGSLSFQPPIASIQEFKVDNSTFSAEYGHVSGAIVNIVTRSGTDEFRGEAFEFFRNDALDARNFFEFTSPDPHPFERNQFGGSLGGPIVRGRTFFFATYEGLRQRQGLDMNSLVLSDEQRAAATDPVSRRLIALIPRANYFDADGTPRFVGSAAAAVDNDRWTARRPAQRRHATIASTCSSAASASGARADVAGQQHSRVRHTCRSRTRAS